jgi:hypothetical protein
LRFFALAALLAGLGVFPVDNFAVFFFAGALGFAAGLESEEVSAAEESCAKPEGEEDLAKAKKCALLGSPHATTAASAHHHLRLDRTTFIFFARRREPEPVKRNYGMPLSFEVCTQHGHVFLGQVAHNFLLKIIAIRGHGAAVALRIRRAALLDVIAQTVVQVFMAPAFVHLRLVVQLDLIDQ